MTEEEIVRQAYIKGYNDALKKLEGNIEHFLGYERYEHVSFPPEKWTTERKGRPFSALLEDIKKASQDKQNSDLPHQKTCGK